MKSICLLESVSRVDGGIFEAESALQRHLHLHEGVDVRVVALDDRFTSRDIHCWSPIQPRTLAVQGFNSFGYSAGFPDALDFNADLLHASSLWRYPSWAALNWAKLTRKPMIVTPHGSLDSWALNHSAWKKWIAAILFKNRQLSMASCLRALCLQEVRSIRSYGIKAPVCLIPNGVEMPEVKNDNPRKILFPHPVKTLLFLGRLHPKKGLVNALRAWATARKRSGGAVLEWRFVIAGWDQGGHEAELIQLCRELGLKSAFMDSKHRPSQRKLTVEKRCGEGECLDAEVLFHGPAFGQEKEDLLRSAVAFILPSLSEGLPMSVLEAWSYGLPVLITPQCNLAEGFSIDAGIRIETRVEDIGTGLETLFLMSDGDRKGMGDRGRELVRERFTWRRVAAEMKSVYEWVLGGGPPPECIV
jgi:poly(glycerol-phosphate) alpha-glucosyltransferase